MAGGRRHWGGVPAGIGLHLQEVVWFVLDDDEIVLLCNLVHGMAAFRGLGGTGRVLACWDGVQHVRLARTPGGDVPVSEDFVHCLRDETLLVHWDARHLYAKGEGGLGGTGEGIFLHKDVVSALTEHAESGVPGVGAASRQGALPVGVWRTVDDLIQLVYVEELKSLGVLYSLRCAL